MTTETQTRMADRMLTLLLAQPANVQARYESKIVEAQKGTLSDTLAMQIIRQVGGFSSPAEGEDARTMPKSNGETRTSTRSNDASESQARYAVDLLKTRVAPDERVTGSVKTAAEVLALFEASGRMSRDMARNVIDSYRLRARIAPAAPKAPATPKAAPVELEAGIYQMGDDVYKVQKSRQSGRMYAQKLVDGRFNYDQGWGALRTLRASHLMTTEQAAAFGQRFGMCVNGHPLSDRTSRYFGYGESCANTNGWTYDKKLVPANFE